MTRVSVYVKGDRNSTAYYRIYQYLDKIKGIKCDYHMMMSSRIHDRYMPVSAQPLFIKTYIYIYIYFRILYALIRDLFKRPQVVVIHRRIISRFMPLSYKILLRIIKSRHTKIIWDFDDNITESKEVSKNTFLFYSELAHKIIVTHQYLKELICKEYCNKVMIMPTTDGDMYKLFEDSDINKKRLESFDTNLQLVWVATSSNLKFLSSITPTLDSTAKQLTEKRNLTLTLNVVCDVPLLDHNCQYLKVMNIKWTRDIAIETMKNSHIGLMPLFNNEFTKGKGGFKLVQYMSIGLPSIGSNVGFNTYVLDSNAGLLVDNAQEWEDAIIRLSDKDTWLKYSKAAYKKWLKSFSYIKNLNEWEDIIIS